MLVRFGVSVEKELLEEFDKIIENRGYTNRSEAIRDLMREMISRKKIGECNDAIATISVMYTHSGNTPIKVLEAQHHAKVAVCSSTHVHLAKDLCFEAIIAKGPACELEKFADLLQSMKGVIGGGITVMPLSPEEDNLVV